jgi:hypothetical protein
MRTRFETAAFADGAMRTYKGLARLNDTTVEKLSDEVEMIL